MDTIVTTKAYSYIRFSTVEQAKGDSLRRQVELREEFVRDNNLELDENLTLHDLGVSAFKGANADEGALGVFLKAVDSGKIEPGSYLLMESLDRLSRASVDVALELFLRIIRKGIIIATLLDNRQYSAASIKSGNFTELIVSIAIMARAHDESLTKSKRIAKAWKKKRSKAVEEGKIVTNKPPFWLKLNAEKTGFEVIEEQAEIVRSVFRMSSEGVGVFLIAKKFTTQGLKAPRGNPWSHSAIGKLLRNRMVIGEASFGPDDDIVTLENYFPKIVSNEIFMDVQDRLNTYSVAKGGGKKSDYRNLFRGLLRCPYCGSSISLQAFPYTAKDGKKLTASLFCVDKSRGVVCDYQRWDYYDFQKVFLKYVQEIDLSVLADSSNNAEIEQAKESLASARIDREKVQKKIGNMLALVEDGGVELKSVTARIKELEQLDLSLETVIATYHRLLDKLEAKIRITNDSREHLKMMVLKLSDPDHSPSPVIKYSEELIEFRAKVSALISAFVDEIQVYSVGATTWFNNDLSKNFRFMVITFKNGVKRGLAWNGTSLTMAHNENSTTWTSWENGGASSRITFEKEKLESK